MIWIAFGVGLFIGTFVGIFTMGLCQMVSKSGGYYKYLEENKDEISRTSI